MMATAETSSCGHPRAYFGGAFFGSTGCIAGCEINGASWPEHLVTAPVQRGMWGILALKIANNLVAMERAILGSMLVPQCRRCGGPGGAHACLRPIS